MSDNHASGTTNIHARLSKRRRRDALLRWSGRVAFFLALGALASLLLGLVNTGRTAFFHHTMEVEVSFDADRLTSVSTPGGNLDYRSSNFRPLILEGLSRLDTPQDPSIIAALLSDSGAPNRLRQALHMKPERLNKTVTLRLPLSPQADQYLKGRASQDLTARASNLLDDLVDRGIIRTKFNTLFLTGADSQSSELSGIASALTGSFLSLIVAFLLAVPMGIGAAIYLQEFAPRNAFTRFIEININNLAAVPALVFGLLGLAVLINIVGFARSVPLVAGMVFALRTFPTIIITTRQALTDVPKSIAQGALSVGASPIQSVFHHKLPYAGPGILTGTIIAMAQAFGETAPLLMIGMVAFISDVPESVTDPATTLPVQIFMWSESTTQSWQEKTAAAILVLLFVLVLINGLTAYLRYRLEKNRKPSP